MIHHQCCLTRLQTMVNVSRILETLVPRNYLIKILEETLLFLETFTYFRDTHTYFGDTFTCFGDNICSNRIFIACPWNWLPNNVSACYRLLVTYVFSRWDLSASVSGSASGSSSRSSRARRLSSSSSTRLFLDSLLQGTWYCTAANTTYSALEPSDRWMCHSNWWAIHNTINIKNKPILKM